MHYKTHGYLVHIHQQTVIHNGQRKNIRPKTFSLLIKFLENPYQVLSKQELLTSIWDDVEVQEQVLFQTITELRQVFAGDLVIKTHPRKGYAWVAPVELIAPETEKRSFFKAMLVRLKLWRYPLTAITIVLLLMNISFIYSSYWKSASTVQGEAGESSGSLVILPVENQIKDNDHQWVYLGAMDQLVSSLHSNAKIAVMDTDYVLEILRNADLLSQKSSDKIARIFQVSGAGLIVETQLSGASHQYQLKYTLHFKNTAKRGVIFQSNVNEALNKLSDKIASYTGQDVKHLVKGEHSDFANELMVRALEFSEQGNHLAASKVYQGLLQIEPDNIVARRLIADTYMEMHQLSAAEKHLWYAEQIAQQEHSPELVKIYYLLSYIDYIHGDLEQAKAKIATANQFATEHNDWLYRGFIAQLNAKIAIQTQDYQIAQQSLESALSYYEVMQCPVGKSNTLLEMSFLAHLQEKKAQTQEYFARASQIINQHQLTILQPRLSWFSEKVNINHQFDKIL
ncbi:hypothetical protein tinsulaeT_01840 [Thalassotalea insulae]|uniref:OmpR/PhoB-type domain-containing protein n=1 Tax=Thalassotalea insulae TaxID=2056778 RepID=A0ABQ6GML1_9GAMM|nr:winged helix-turn-helix domain-containing protein [Thalassotalea insulae]GLX76844.1 hypothetical protein tinsulaeT_01840 [Thalassotalea insulae]